MSDSHASPGAMTMLAMGTHGWQIVFLRVNSKVPMGDHWVITNEYDRVYQHLRNGGNIGLVCGPKSGVAVLDFDREGALMEMCQQLGPILPWVQTGSGKYHCYVAWEDGLPSKITWGGETVGEIQRGPALQHVVVPPSIHPGTGLPYTWLVDPTKESLRPLPEEWRNALISEHIPSFIPVGDRSGQPAPEPWAGPPPEDRKSVV